MRLRLRATPVLFVPLLVAGCRGDQIAAPEFRRPLEDLPAGAHAVLVASDLRNTWQRAEGHDLWAVVRQLQPVRRFLEQPGVQDLQTACAAYEARSGAKANEDLLLNALGSRLSLGVYGSHEDREPHLLLVAELADPDRFDAALRSLRPEDFPAEVRLSESTLDGLPTFRIERPVGPSIVVLRQGNFLVATTQDSLARGALSLHSGRSNGSALREEAISSALRAIGQHSVVAVFRPTGNVERWNASGFTWDRRGLHFESLSSAALPAAPSAESDRREEILRSIPDGMTLALYCRGSGLDLGSLAATMREGSADSTVQGPDGPLSLLPGPVRGFLPPEVQDAVGDEFGIALLDVRPTPLAPLPNLGLVLELRDPDAAERTLRVIESAMNMVRLQGRSHDFEDVNYGGRTFRSLVQPLSEALTPSWIIEGDIAIITSTRELMQQFIDTRRTGKRHLLGDSTFRPFRDFVPRDAWAVVYTDQRRLHRVLQQLGTSNPRWNESVGKVIPELERLAALGEHFPAGAAYATREQDRIAVRGWVVEGN